MIEREVSGFWCSTHQQELKLRSFRSTSSLSTQIFHMKRGYCPTGFEVNFPLVRLSTTTFSPLFRPLEPRSLTLRYREPTGGAATFLSFFTALWACEPPPHVSRLCPEGNPRTANRVSIFFMYPAPGPSLVRGPTYCRFTAKING